MKYAYHSSYITRHTSHVFYHKSYFTLLNSHFLHHLKSEKKIINFESKKLHRTPCDARGETTEARGEGATARSDTTKKKAHRTPCEARDETTEARGDATDARANPPLPHQLRKQVAEVGAHDHTVDDNAILIENKKGRCARYGKTLVEVLAIGCV